MLRAGANHRRAGGICSERLNGRGREHGNIRVPTGFGSKRAICVVPHAGAAEHPAHADVRGVAFVLNIRDAGAEKGQIASYIGRARLPECARLHSALLAHLGRRPFARLVTGKQCSRMRDAQSALLEPCRCTKRVECSAT
eukprot:189374-Prorocentrum_minimum.AAC.1